MKRRGLVFIALFIICGHFSWGQIILNEIMYHAGDSDLEYVELYNAGRESVDLSGWSLQDDNDAHRFVFPIGLSIRPDEYLVIADDGELFRETYGFAPTLAGILFNFSNDGDAVRLFDASQQLIEAVAYDDRSPWPDEADGGGASLERKHALLPSNLPAAWAASPENGTPGRKNAAHTDSLPPLILAVDHTPRIPQPNETVTVTARVLDVDGGVDSVTLYYGWNGGSAYQSVDMADDGLHGDGSDGDGVYGAEISGAAAGTILHFYIEAKDNDRLLSRLPEEGRNQPYLTVFERALPNERVPILRVVMLPDVNAQFLNRYQTDEYFPASFYDGDQVYYQIHIRHRGRSRVRNGRFKIRFPHHQLYRGAIRRLNFNGTDVNTILREYLSYQLYQDAGLPNLESELVRFHINGLATQGTPYRTAIENPDGQFLRRKQFFNRDGGNLYKTTLDRTPQNKATWRYVGEDPDLYRFCYIKQTNEEEDDFSDIIRFCRVLSEANVGDTDYLENVYSVLHVDDFLRWMAVSACVAHWDSPFTDHGHNYVLYNNPSTNQFHVIAWDLNGTFNYTSNTNDLNYRKLYTHIRSTKFPAINKILNHPVFGAQYYREIEGLMETLFSSSAMNRRIDEAAYALQLNTSSVAFFKTYVAQRIADLSLWIGRERGMAFLTKPVYQTNVGESYLYRAAAVDYRQYQSFAYSLHAGPSWLTVDAKSGELTGVPTQEGRFDVIVQAETRNGASITQEYSLHVVNPNPRLIMTFNEEGETVNDFSDFANHGAIRGNVTRMDGRLGKGVYLSGRNSYVEIPHTDSLNLSGAVTVEAWIRPDVISTGNPIIVTKGNEDTFNYTLMLGYGPWNWDQMEPGFMPHRFDIENRVYYGRKEIEAQLRNRRWVHIAGTYDSREELVCVYANNRRIVESSSRARMEENGRNLWIGLNGNRSFQGVVDDVRILPFAKQAFAAGLCLSQVDVSGISPAQEQIALSLSAYRDGGVETGEYCIHLVKANRWFALPSRQLAAGETVRWWLDDVGVDEPLWKNEIMALYPIETMGEAKKEFVLDQIAWGDAAPDANDAGVNAGVWRRGKSASILENQATTLALKHFADNDEMDLDWEARPQTLDGPVIASFMIEDGAAMTRNRVVRLRIHAANADSSWRMRIANDGAMRGEWIPFAATAEWQLPPGDGEKTVYMQAIDTSGRRSPVVFAAIRLEEETGISNWGILE